MNLTLEQLGLVVTILCAIAGGIAWLIGRSEKKTARIEREKLDLATKLTSIEAQLGYLRERDKEHAVLIGQLQQDVGTLVRELLMTKM